MAKKKAESEEKGGKGGCLIPIVILIALLLIGGGGSKDRDSSSKASKATAKPTATATKTPKPKATATKTPKPTATNVPDFSSMDAVSAAEELAKYYCDDMIVVDVEKTNNYITIEIHADSFLTVKMFVRDCCRSTMYIAESLFENQSFDTLNVKFSTDGRDKYGNEQKITAVTIRLTRETSSKINYEYMRMNLGATTNGFLSITDSYFVHPDLMTGVY